MNIINNDGKILTGTFTSDGSGPQWGMSLRASGSMRFRWNETNPNRIRFLEKLCLDSENDTKNNTENCADNSSVNKKEICQVELIHSKTVYAVDSSSQTWQKTGDGIITKNKGLIPVVTVADCMPIFLYDPVTQVFGMLHSGWKGTGIGVEAIKLAQKEYGSKPEDFMVVMGPHIHDCCYCVDEQRAEYFRTNFTPDCVTPDLRLSLAQANRADLLRIGVKDENICISPDCTCCNQIYGSFRRENPSAGSFTVQVAWVKW